MSPTRWLHLFALLSASLGGGASQVLAHDALRLTHGAIVTAGSRVDAEGAWHAITVVGEPLGGSRPTLQALSEGATAIVVEGALNEPARAVVINGVAATRQGPSFRATGIRLLEGPNPITVTATDVAGNRSDQEITVWLDTHPPARPTVADTPTVLGDSTLTLTGTKTPGTSLWINGVEIMPWNLLTTWSVTMTLAEGDHRLSVVTRDEVDHRSTAATVIVVVDALPPVITVTAPALTNLTPLALQGTVDDSLTRVTVNGMAATRSGLRFEAALPLVEGDNPVTITATSPNGYVSTKTLAVILGTIPTITAVEPADGSRLSVDTPVTICAQATDKEHNPMEYQLWLDGQLLVDWAREAAFVWTPARSHGGLHALEARVRDGFGGVASKQAEVYVLRTPISPP